MGGPDRRSAVNVLKSPLPSPASANRRAQRGVARAWIHSIRPDDHQGVEVQVGSFPAPLLGDPGDVVRRQACSPLALYLPWKLMFLPWKTNRGGSVRASGELGGRRLLLRRGGGGFHRLLGLSAAEIGLALTVAWTAGFLATTPVGRIADRVGARPVAVALSLVTAAATGGMLLHSGPVSFTGVAVVYAVAQSGLGVARQTLVIALVDAGERHQVPCPAAGLGQRRHRARRGAWSASRCSPTPRPPTPACWCWTRSGSCSPGCCCSGCPRPARVVRPARRRAPRGPPSAGSGTTGPYLRSPGCTRSSTSTCRRSAWCCRCSSPRGRPRPPGPSPSRSSSTPPGSSPCRSGPAAG